ncbi:MAG: ferric reductase-like transmembrane domain-containing protein [Patescibacteria group bacterium]
MTLQVLFAKASWILLIIILMVRPLNDLFHHKILVLILRYRKYLGIICGLFAFLHVILFLTTTNGIRDFFTNSLYWRFDNFFGWGSIALILMFFPLITSNKYSQTRLKSYWKKIQQLSYPAFILVAVHVVLVKKEFSALIPVTIWLILWVSAFFKKKYQRKNLVK